MGGVVDSVGGFLGTSSGPNVQLNTANPYMQGLNNTDITAAVQNNPIYQQGLGALQGQLGTGQGMESQQQGVLNNLQSQGFNLQPQDQTLYGQEAGNIARQFGQQGNQAASDLASRGLSNSGAAGATFSGLAGNQNEMLAQAQQQIAQQRFQNTQNQIAQQQGFLSQLNAQNQQGAQGVAGFGQNAYANQYQNQLGAVNAANSSNSSANNALLGQAGFNAANRPANFADYTTSGFGKGLQQQGNNMSDPFNSGSGSPGSIMGSQQQAASGAGGGGGGFASMASMFSDKRLKQNIVPLDSRAILDPINGYVYDYIDSAYGEGPQIGVMAQDLEQSMPKLVRTAPNGYKKVGISHFEGALLALVADMNKRIVDLESR